MKTTKQNVKAVIEAEELLAKIEGGSKLSNNYMSKGMAHDVMCADAVGPGVQIYGCSLAD
ncbi:MULTISPECIES: hypothetical protein [unclassified Pseudoalteromonas]|uniref:hypothetical protein n=1 Tax=unclassified Pseudoalteromonas TaxID=194690 RepID=UPI0006B4C9FA|nr:MULTISPECIES: hypothetical protein [unclassified Pseudoalteromonas]AZZ97147.1 hypothetical protein ELR70_08310 [Pseudoalteromonas sp. R3]MCO7188172.1 hypothetical protein [Pseudoalteromonas sp. XMcav2-N]